ncbi:MAG TPA: acyl carrier protein [Syntrophales bacterium]|nr:acyl carrier protein [Syntrophales bacterium]
MANTDPIMEFIKNQLVREKTMKNIGRGDDLIESGIIDSLGILKLLEFLESKFSIHIADEELIPENFHSIESIESFISRKKNII